MALLLMLIERKDYITNRLSELERIAEEIKQTDFQKREDEDKPPGSDDGEEEESGMAK